VASFRLDSVTWKALFFKSPCYHPLAVRDHKETPALFAFSQVLRLRIVWVRIDLGFR